MESTDYSKNACCLITELIHVAQKAVFFFCSHMKPNTGRLSGWNNEWERVSVRRCGKPTTMLSDWDVLPDLLLEVPKESEIVERKPGGFRKGAVDSRTLTKRVDTMSKCHRESHPVYPLPLLFSVLILQGCCHLSWAWSVGHLCRMSVLTW